MVSEPPSISTILPTMRFMNSRSCEVISRPALVALEELLEPDDAFEVEMVARLVEQHGVGIHEQDAGQRHASHLPARPTAPPHVPVHHLRREAEAGEHLAGAPVERIAVELLKRACTSP